MESLGTPPLPMSLADRTPPIRRRRWLLAFALLPTPASAQQAVPAPSSSGASLVDEFIELSSFVVAGRADEGYVASNTLAGSRLNTSLRDVASPLEVFTKDLTHEP